MWYPEGRFSATKVSYCVCSKGGFYGCVGKRSLKRQGDCYEDYCEQNGIKYPPGRHEVANGVTCECADDRKFGCTGKRKRTATCKDGGLEFEEGYFFFVGTLCLCQSDGEIRCASPDSDRLKRSTCDYCNINQLGIMYPPGSHTIGEMQCECLSGGNYGCVG